MDDIFHLLTTFIVFMLNLRSFRPLFCYICTHIIFLDLKNERICNIRSQG